MLLVFYGDRFIPEYADTLDDDIIAKGHHWSVKYSEGGLLSILFKKIFFAGFFLNFLIF